jgi:hypothetical protein
MYNIEDALAAIERARQGHRHDETKILVEKLFAQLGEDLTTEAVEARARANYELSEASWQLALTLNVYDNRDLVEESLRLARLSAQQAGIAGDQVGKLLAEFSASNILIDLTDRQEEGLALLRQATQQAEALMPSSSLSSRHEILLAEIEHARSLL